MSNEKKTLLLHFPKIHSFLVNYRGKRNFIDLESVSDRKSERDLEGGKSVEPTLERERIPQQFTKKKQFSTSSSESAEKERELLSFPPRR
jgi:hypothetical protein